MRQSLAVGRRKASVLIIDKMSEEMSEFLIVSGWNRSSKAGSSPKGYSDSLKKYNKHPNYHISVFFVILTLPLNYSGAQNPLSSNKKSLVL